MASLDGLSLAAGVSRLFAFDEAVSYVNDAICESGHFWIVRHHNDGLLPTIDQVAQQPHHLRPICGIQVAGWLVGQQQGGFDGQCASDCHTLLFSARHGAGDVMPAMRDDDLLKLFQGSTARLSRLDSIEHKRQCHIFFGRERVQQIEGLEDEPKPLATHDRSLVVVEARHVDAFDQNLAGRRHFNAADNIQQRALAGAARPHDGHPLPFANLQIDATEGFDTSFCRTVDFG